MKKQKSDRFLRTRQSADASPKMTQMWELSHNETAITTILHNCTVKVNTTEVNKKIDVSR